MGEIRRVEQLPKFFIGGAHNGEFIGQCCQLKQYENNSTDTPTAPFPPKR